MRLTDTGIMFTSRDYVVNYTRKGKTLFDLLIEVVRQDDSDSSPSIAFRYPYASDDEDVVKNALKFVFPFDADFESPAVDQFTFVFTDIEGKFKFGFCRLSAGSRTCFCLISCYPWFEVFYKLLNVIVEIRNQTDKMPTLISLLDSLYVLEPAAPGETVQASSNDSSQVFTFVCPDARQLPSIPQSRNLTEYYCAIDTYNMMLIFASMLVERRILVTSRKLSRLTACVHGAASLLSPLNWQHLYIPILPRHLLDYCSAPMPYLIGVHSTLWQYIRKEELGDVIILDADDNNVMCSFDDLAAMPQDVVSRLKKQLKAHRPGKESSSPPAVFMGDTISRAFLQTLVALFGGYRDALRFRNGKISFDKESFLKTRPPGMQTFLQNSLRIQTFQQFIDERLDLLNSSKGFADAFEMEIDLYRERNEKSDNKKSWKKSDKKLQDLTSKVARKSIKTLKNVKTKFVDDWKKIDSCSNPIQPPIAYQRTMSNVLDGQSKQLHQTLSAPYTTPDPKPLSIAIEETSPGSPIEKPKRDERVVRRRKKQHVSKSDLGFTQRNMFVTDDNSNPVDYMHFPMEIPEVVELEVETSNMRLVDLDSDGMDNASSHENLEISDLNNVERQEIMPSTDDDDSNYSSCDTLDDDLKDEENPYDSVELEVIERIRIAEGGDVTQWDALSLHPDQCISPIKDLVSLSPTKSVDVNLMLEPVIDASQESDVVAVKQQEQPKLSVGQLIKKFETSSNLQNQNLSKSRTIGGLHSRETSGSLVASRQAALCASLDRNTQTNMKLASSYGEKVVSPTRRLSRTAAFKRPSAFAKFTTSRDSKESEENITPDEAQQNCSPEFPLAAASAEEIFVSSGTYRCDEISEETSTYEEIELPSVASENKLISNSEVSNDRSFVENRFMQRSRVPNMTESSTTVKGDGLLPVDRRFVEIYTPIGFRSFNNSTTSGVHPDLTSGVHPDFSSPVSPNHINDRGELNRHRQCISNTWGPTPFKRA